MSVYKTNLFHLIYNLHFPSYFTPSYQKYTNLMLCWYTVHRPLGPLLLKHYIYNQFQFPSTYHSPPKYIHFVTTETQSGLFIHNQRTGKTSETLVCVYFLFFFLRENFQKCYFSFFHPLKSWVFNQIKKKKEEKLFFFLHVRKTFMLHSFIT